jgi:hypothetical protein
MILPTLLLAAALAADGTHDAPLARVDDVAITAADLAERSRVLASKGLAAGANDALESLVSDALLAREARRRGLTARALAAFDLEGERRRLAVEHLLSADAAGAPPSEAELLALYHAGADSIRLVLVKVTTEDEAKVLAARARAGADLAELAASGADRDLAARRGDTGLVPRSQLDPALAEAAFAARPGDLVGPVALALGFAVARVVEKNVADEAAFPSRRPSLEAFLRKRRAQAMKAHLGPRLEQRYGVVVDEAFLSTLPPGPATPAQRGHVVARIAGKPLTYGELEPAVTRVLAAVSGHMSNPRIRSGLVRTEVRERVLAHAAYDRGHATAPEVVRALAVIERNVLASALRTELARAAGPLDAEEAVASSIASLRKGARIEIDRKKLAELGP